MKLLITMSACLLLSFSIQAQSKITATLNNKIQQTLNKFCTDCHGEKRKKGKVRLDNFADLSKMDKFEMMNRIEEQVFLGNMPPDDEDVLPSDKERQTFLNDISSVYELLGSESNLRQKLSKPEYGNYVDHEKLFSGKYKHLKGFTHDRKWLVSEYIFANKINRLVGHNSRRGKVAGGLAVGGGIGNPFTISDDGAVQYHANQPLSSGHFMVMLENADLISKYLINHSNKNKRSKFSVIRKVLSLEEEHKATLASRNKFLNEYIDIVCKDIYREKHESLLPKYIPVELNSKQKELIRDYRSQYASKKRPHLYGESRNSINRGLLQKTLSRFAKNMPKSYEELYEKCDKFLFYTGVAETVRQRQMIFMKAFTKRMLVKDAPRELKYRPLKADEMKVIVSTIKKVRKKGMKLSTIHQLCMQEWRSQFQKELNEQPAPSQKDLTELIDQCYKEFFYRSPSTNEITENIELLRNYSQNLGRRNGIDKFIQTLVLKSEFILRYEYGSGKADKYGRKMLSPRDASFALAYALTDSPPDKGLQKAVKEGRLSSKGDYRREIIRILKDRSHISSIDKIVEGDIFSANVTNTPIRKLRFFRDFFGYPGMLKIFKDDKRFGAKLQHVTPRLVSEADMLVDHIINKDKNVFEELLTTEKFYYLHTGNNGVMLGYSNELKKTYEYFKDIYKNIKTNQDLLKHKEILKKVSFPDIKIKELSKKGKSRSLQNFHKLMKTLVQEFAKGQEYSFPIIDYNGGKTIWGRRGKLDRVSDVLIYWGIDKNKDSYAPVQPAKVANRKGMLTHPAWLAAHSLNQATDPVIRGKWIRERLLAGTVPDIPITVDAVIPEDPHKTLRQRLVKVTEVPECWKCHKYMNPLGYPLESFDDFGRYRTEEALEYPENIIPQKLPPGLNRRQKGFYYTYHPLKYKTLPVNSAGHLKGTDSQLDGDVKDAFDMIDRIAKARKTRQSIIRYAFRYFMGRNEMLSDSKTLIDAEEAYVKNGGSFDAVIVSLLTSDSFMYRKEKLKE